MRFDLVTIFPDMVKPVLAASLLGKARERGLIDVRVHDLRRWADPPHRQVDDYAYGGGPGMLMKPEPIVRAVEELRTGDSWTVLLSPQAPPLTQPAVRRLADRGHLILVCGRYEGVDDRVRELVIDEEVSIGDYVVAGGEVPALVLIEATSRLIPGVVGCDDSVRDESHAAGLLEYPQYTRPEEFHGRRVPATLRSGDHGRVAAWRRAHALRRTLDRRPDLLLERELTDAQRRQLAEFDLDTHDSACAQPRASTPDSEGAASS